MKKAGQQAKTYTPAVRRLLREAIYDFHVRAFGEEMARVNHLPLAAGISAKWLTTSFERV
jgi:hypothetical protein